MIDEPRAVRDLEEGLQVLYSQTTLLAEEVDSLEKKSVALSAEIAEIAELQRKFPT